MLKFLVSKLQSRKFLLSVGAFVAALDAGDVKVAAGVAVGYCIAEGWIDAKSVNSVTFK